VLAAFQRQRESSLLDAQWRRVQGELLFFPTLSGILRTVETKRRGWVCVFHGDENVAGDSIDG
jgi:hypothetical protein